MVHGFQVRSCGLIFIYRDSMEYAKHQLLSGLAAHGDSDKHSLSSLGLNGSPKSGFQVRPHRLVLQGTDGCYWRFGVD